MSTIELKRGNVTSVEQNITATVGDYEIKANYTKLGDDDFKAIDVSLASGEVFTAKLSRQDNGAHLNVSIPADITDEEKVTVFNTMLETYNQIKTF